MFLDNALTFNTNWATPQVITTTADSTGIIDITGAGSGNAPAMINGFPATNTAIGADYGAAGDGVVPPWVVVCVTVAPTSGSNTLIIKVESAPDNGSFGQGSYTICGQTDTMVGSLLTAGSIILFPLPPRKLGAALPRFYKLNYTASATLTPMAVLAGITINPTSFANNGPQINSNFVVV